MRISNICFAVATLLTFISCSGFDKLVKGRDYEKQYSEALRYYQIKKDNRAIALFNGIETIFNGTDRIDTIKFYKAKAHYRQGDFTISSELFDEFRKTFTRSIFAEESEFLYAMSFYESAPNPELDQTATAQAIEAFSEYLDRYPESPRKEACDEMIVELQGRLYQKAFIVANTYFNVGYYNSAIHSFKNVLKLYPEIPQREQIVFLLVKSNYLYAKASVQRKQRERFLNTIDAYYNFITEYPESSFKNEAQRMFSAAQKLSKAKSIIESTGETLGETTRKIERQENKIMKLADKVDKKKITPENAEGKVKKSLNKKIDRADKKIESERKKTLEEKEAQIIPTEITSTGSEVLKNTTKTVDEILKGDTEDEKKIKEKKEPKKTKGKNSSNDKTE